jgi:carbon storage regulator
MLVLSRKADQQIVLPGLGVTIRMLEVRGQAVRLGVSAPKSIAVHRSELLTGAVAVDGQRAHQVLDDANSKVV